MNRFARTAAVLLVVPILGLGVIDIDRARAQLDIAIGDLTRDECARMCAGLVNPTGCRHAYYVGATRTCHLTDQDQQQLNFRPGLEIWSLNLHKWLTPDDVTSAGGFEDGFDRPGSDIKPASMSHRRRSARRPAHRHPAASPSLTCIPAFRLRLLDVG